MTHKTFLAGLLASTLLLGACAAPGPNASADLARQDLARIYGGLGPRDNTEIFRTAGTSGKGFVMIRTFMAGDITPGRPWHFTADPRGDTASVRVLDAGIEMKTSAGIPLYRVALRPRNLDSAMIAALPRNFEIRMPDGEGLRQISAQLARNATPDRNGLIWTDWTYCPDCLGLREIAAAQDAAGFAAFAALEEAQNAAAAPNGTSTAFSDAEILFDVTGPGIRTGRQAEILAPRAAETVMEARTRMRRLPSEAGVQDFTTQPGPVAGRLPQAYANLIANYADSISPARAIQDACGPYGVPSGISGSVGARKAAATQLYQSWEACAVSTIERFDAGQRQREIAAFASEEERLARAEGLAPGMRRMPLSIEAEMAAAADLARAAHDAFQAHVARLDGEGRDSGEMLIEAPQAGPVVPSGAFELKGDVREGLPAEALSEDAAANSEPPSMATLFVARLENGAANREIGAGGSACVAGVDCEIGRIVALIAVEDYCAAAGGVSQTTAGWGLMVQRYKPSSRAEEKAIVQAGGALIHAVASSDAAALDAGLAQLSAVRRTGEDPTLFRTYPDFYAVNTEQKGCTDAWRDAARQRVVHNM